MNKNTITASAVIIICFLVTILVLQNSKPSESVSYLEQKSICESYRKNIEGELLNDKYDSGYIEQSVDEIWYSTKYDTCFYSIIISTEFYATPSREAVPKSVTHHINDYYKNIQVPEFNTSNYSDFISTKNKLQ